MKSSEVWVHIRKIKLRLKIPYDYQIQVMFSDISTIRSNVLTKKDRIIGSSLSLNKNEKLDLNILNHFLSQAKHFSMNFPYISAKKGIKSKAWFLYYTLKEYNSNLIELEHFKNQFKSDLEKQREITNQLVKHEKELKKYISKLADQNKVEILSDFYRMKVLCDNLSIDSKPYDECIKTLKKEYFYVLDQDAWRETKELFEKMFPTLPKARYSNDDIKKITNFFDINKVQTYLWK